MSQMSPTYLTDCLRLRSDYILRRVRLVVLLISIVFCLSAVDAFGQYRYDSWTTDNGLPQNSIQDILQTSDGYLWFTTFDGVVRYDGVRFTVFNKGNAKGIRSSRFTRLFEDRHGNLWIGIENGGLTRYKDGVF